MENQKASIYVESLPLETARKLASMLRKAAKSMKSKVEVEVGKHPDYILLPQYERVERVQEDLDRYLEKSPEFAATSKREVLQDVKSLRKFRSRLEVLTAQLGEATDRLEAAAKKL